MVKNKELVSVIMSTYNNNSTLSDSIESILNQTYKKIELLIVDDGSSDNSFEIMKGYNKDYKNCLIYKNEKNIGLTKSLNFLISKSNGEYIARQDADDISYLNRIEIQKQIVEKYNLDFCSTRAIIRNTNKVIPNLSYFIPNKLLINFKNPFIHGTLFIKSEVLISLGLYDEDFYYAQDYKLMSDLIRKQYNYKMIKKPLYELNMENNISSEFRKEQNYYSQCVKKNVKPGI